MPPRFYHPPPPHQLSFSSFSGGDRFFSWRERCRGNNYLLAVGRTDSVPWSVAVPWEPITASRVMDGPIREGSLVFHQVTRRLQRSASNYRQQRLLRFHLISFHCVTGIEASIKWRGRLCFNIKARSRNRDRGPRTSNNGKSGCLFYSSKNTYGAKLYAPPAT